MFAQAQYVLHRCSRAFFIVHTKGLVGWSTAQTGTEFRVCSGPGTGPFLGTAARATPVACPYSIGLTVDRQRPGGLSNIHYVTKPNVSGMHSPVQTRSQTTHTAIKPISSDPLRTRSGSTPAPLRTHSGPTPAPLWTDSGSTPDPLRFHSGPTPDPLRLHSGPTPDQGVTAGELQCSPEPQNFRALNRKPIRRQYTLSDRVRWTAESFNIWS
jgi:hypothetical protein